MSVTVVIPTIRTRADMLARALTSVTAQTRQPDAIAVANDVLREGAPATRNRALDAVRTEWVAFLDDDDELEPCHIVELLDAAADNDADVVYPRYRAVDRNGRRDARQEQLVCPGEPFDPRRLRRQSYIPVTSLVRTELAHQVGGFSYPNRSRYEDWGLYLKLLDVGARFHHHPVVTWTWHLHGDNTGGRPERWAA